MALPPDPFDQAVTTWKLDQLYSDLATAKREIAPYKKLGLTEVEKLHLRGLLCGYSPAEIATQLVKTAKTVEVDLCNTLYRYVEALTGRATNTLESWRDIKPWLEAAGYKAFGVGREMKLALNWGEAPDVSVFYGRQEELATLGQWIVGDRCRIVALLGMGGIGKTSLAARLAQQIQGQFDCLIWRSLRHPLPLEEVLGDWLQLLSPQPITESPSKLESQLTRLIDHLRSHRCLLILDNLETILRSGDFAGHYREGYKSYGELLQRLSQETHQSCLLLTSREQTREIALLDGRNQPVRSLKLEGLKEAAREILQAKDLSGEGQWSTLIQIYRGNPLVLKMVSTTIKEIFDGSVPDFLKQRMTLITGDINDFIEQQVNRLSSLEQEILYQVVRAKEPVLLIKLQESLQSVLPSDLLRALESLVRRSLIEKSVAGFTLQPVVMEYVTNQLEQIKQSEG
ncbi:NB-ARC domain-containing protein [Trichocoleus desertorum AS-A10]|uniref:NB-ARC domain-containing protein n=1 Tax=Trichocoleus desertorum TaxID=1481672 RepID=UPI0032994337